jgi:predicted extracellular nuclease
MGLGSQAGRPTRLVLLYSAILTALAGLPLPAIADNVAQPLPFSQNWTDPGLITADDDWSGVPGIVGYRGDGLTSTNDVDPQTVLGEGSPPVVDVIANRTNPVSLLTGGVAEFDTAPYNTVALQGSGTADAPSIVLHLNTTGAPTVAVSYNLRDIDGSSDNAVQQVALQYRVGSTGNFINVPAGYVADATTGPMLETLVTPVSVTLPDSAAGQSMVQVRIITTNASGSDEWVGVDDIHVASGDAPPSVSSTTPADGAADVELNSNISITFTEAVNVAGSWFSIACEDSGSHTAAVAGGPTTFTLDPDADFASSETCVVTVFAAQVTDQDSNDPPDNMAADFSFGFQTVSPPAPPTPIYEIQGSGSTSPFAGTEQTTTGIVTTILGSGFFMQDSAGDGDADTSDGIFVFTGSSTARTLAPGDEVRVTGTVVEFRPTSRPRDLTLTEFSPATVTRTGTGAALPSPVEIGDRPDEVIAPDGIDAFERLEGMLVAIDSPRVSGPTNDFGEFVVAASGDQANMTADGNFIVRPLPGDAVDYNPERIMVDDEARVPGGSGSGTRINNPMVPVTVGDTATGDIVGPLDYQFSNYRVQANHSVSSVLTGSSPDSPIGGLRSPEPFEGRIATFNVENLFDCVDAPNKADDHPTCNAAALAALETQLAKLAMAFEQELGSPEVAIIEETENTLVLTGDANGFVPGTTIPALLPRVDGNFQARSFDASDERGIEVAFVYNADRVTLHEAYLSTAVLPDGGLFTGSATIRPGREPLVGFFTIDDVDAIVVGNHLKSKGGPQFGVDPLEAGDDPLYGAFQPPTRWTEVQLRHQQADYVRDLVDLLLTENPGASILVGGDMNDFHFGEPGEGQHTLARMMDSPTDPLTNVIPFISEDERYTFIFEGNSQVLDHMLLNEEMAGLLRDQGIAHFNSDYPSALGSNASVTARSSDHDPLAAYFCTDATPPELSAQASPNQLWPPNHRYVTVQATTDASDDRDPTPSVSLVSVTSNEPDDAPGDGDGSTTNDILIVDDDTFRLRAERSEDGTGRIYTITYLATDACGNVTEATTTVRVPIGFRG